MCAVYTDVPTYVRGSSSVHSCVREIMHACVCHGLFVCWLELTYNCLWFDGLFVYWLELTCNCLWFDGLFVYWLELTYNCLWFDSGLCFARVLFFTLLFFVYYVCIIAFDMVVLCEAMLICLF